MNNILEILDKFSVALGQAKADAAKAVTDSQALLNKLEDDKLAVAAERAALDQREAEIRKVENVIAFKEEAKKLMGEAQDALTAVNKEKDSFEAYRVDTTKKLNTHKNELDEQAKQQKVESDNLKSGLEKLNQDRKNLKEDVLAEIAKKVK